MQTATLTILNALGLHARPSAKISNLANRFQSKILLTINDKTIDAKSIMQVMMLAAGQGSTLALETEGTDEDEALTAMIELFNSRFDEKE